jgi:hypothetical protein
MGTYSNRDSYPVANQHALDERGFDPLKRVCRVTGLAYAWFGGPGCAESGKKNEFEARIFLRHPDMRIVGVCTEKASPLPSVLELSPAAPNVPAKTGKNAKEQMKMNNLAKAVVLGLAALLATSAFASNKGTVELREAFEVNGQQLAAGEYQVRWDGTGSNVEVSFMKGKKEVAKTSAKMVALDKAYGFDSAVVDHSTGKATVSELRFAGKKFALAIGETEKAEMSGGTSK